MAKEKKLIDGRQVTVILPLEQLEWLRSVCLKIAYQRGQAYSISEAIRDAVSAAYPVPKQQQNGFWDEPPKAYRERRKK